LIRKRKRSNWIDGKQIGCFGFQICESFFDIKGTIGFEIFLLRAQWFGKQLHAWQKILTQVPGGGFQRVIFADIHCIRRGGLDRKSGGISSFFIDPTPVFVLRGTLLERVDQALAVRVCRARANDIGSPDS
jgi:hypothetical protein